MSLAAALAATGGATIGAGNSREHGDSTYYDGQVVTYFGPGSGGPGWGNPSNRGHIVQTTDPGKLAGGKIKPIAVWHLGPYGFTPYGTEGKQFAIDAGGQAISTTSRELGKLSVVNDNSKSHKNLGVHTQTPAGNFTHMNKVGTESDKTDPPESSLRVVSTVFEQSGAYMHQNHGIKVKCAEINCSVGQDFDEAKSVVQVRLPNSVDLSPQSTYELMVQDLDLHVYGKMKNRPYVKCTMYADSGAFSRVNLRAAYTVSPTDADVFTVDLSSNFYGVADYLRKANIHVQRLWANGQYTIDLAMCMFELSEDGRVLSWWKNIGYKKVELLDRTYETSSADNFWRRLGFDENQMKKEESGSTAIPQPKMTILGTEGGIIPLTKYLDVRRVGTCNVSSALHRLELRMNLVTNAFSSAAITQVRRDQVSSTGHAGWGEAIVDSNYDFRTGRLVRTDELVRNFRTFSGSHHQSWSVPMTMVRLEFVMRHPIPAVWTFSDRDRLTISIWHLRDPPLMDPSAGQQYYDAASSKAPPPMRKDPQVLGVASVTHTPDQRFQYSVYQ